MKFLSTQTYAAQAIRTLRTLYAVDEILAINAVDGVLQMGRTVTSDGVLNTIAVCAMSAVLCVGACKANRTILRKMTPHTTLSVSYLQGFLIEIEISILEKRIILSLKALNIHYETSNTLLNF